MITTFTTGVELLALSQVARERIYIRRLLRELEVNMNTEKVVIL